MTISLRAYRGVRLPVAMAECLAGTGRVERRRLLIWILELQGLG